jgi:hypothetical protein
VFSSYQIQPTSHANLDLLVHERIGELHKRAHGLAPAVEESALDSGCTDQTKRTHGEMGPRQQKAWDMVAEAHGWNAISDNPELLAQAEAYERGGIAYTLELFSGDRWSPRLVTETAEPEAADVEAIERLLDTNPWDATEPAEPIGQGGDWQVTAQIHTVRDGWQSSRQIPTFTIPRVLAPTLNDAKAKAVAIINPYGDYSVTFDVYATDSNGSYRVWMQSAESDGCQLCRRIGHPMSEPCLP